MSIKGFSIGGVTQKYDYNALDNIPMGEGLSAEAKQAILQIAEKVAYIDAQGQTYYDALHDAFYPPKTVVLITAVFEQGGTVIYDDTALNDLKQYLQVTAKYDDNTTAILADSAYSLSGLLEAPSSTVTVLYNGVSTTFTVAVTARPTLSSITAVYTQSGTVYDTDTLDSLKDDLVVTAVYSDSSTEPVPASDYTLSGTLTAGTSTITVSYGGKTTTFTVTVTAYWDYSWDSSSGTLPDGMTATEYDFTTEPGVLFVKTPKLDFGYTGNCMMRIEIKAYSENSEGQHVFRGSNNPQFQIQNSVVGTNQYRGIKMVLDSTLGTSTEHGMVAVGINGTNALVAGSNSSEYHLYEISANNNVYALSIDGSQVALTQNSNTTPYTAFTGIGSSQQTAPAFWGAFIKSIKLRHL